MPHRIFGVEEVARYLNLNRSDVERLVKEQDIPFERHGSKVVFRKLEIDSWVSPRVLGLQGQRLADYHRKSSANANATSSRKAIFPELFRPGFITPALPAKTKASVLRELTGLAEETGLVWDREGLLMGLIAREDICSTGLPGGLALLHTRSTEPYLFESGFVILARTIQEVPFGAPDGRPTDLFFLIACPDERLHLLTLARLCLVAEKTNLLAELRAATDSQTMYDCLLTAEAVVL